MIHEQVRQLLNEEYEPKKGDTMKCSICGRKAHLLNNGKGPLVCCGKAMSKATVPVTESMGAVMSCRAAKNSIGLWQRRLQRATDERKKLIAKKMINKFKMKVYKCKQRGLMI
jgi:desulfoferrodoxin-like iron-binding protein